MKNIALLVPILLLLGCLEEDQGLPLGEGDQAELSLSVNVSSLSENQLTVQGYVKERPIISHRGTTDYAPENTAAAYRYARNVGADYIQVDIQMTSDGKLVGFRNDLDNHSNISGIFPGFENARVNDFTLAELKLLDVGSWYKDATYKRSGFQGLKILMLEEIINICEGKLPDGSPDPGDVGHRPGIYFRFYEPWLNSGLEQALKDELTRLGWYNDNLDNLKTIATITDMVDVGNTKGRVFLATLEKSSLKKLEEIFEGKLPLAFWLWKSSNYIKEDDAQTYADFINYGIDHGVQFISPNTSTNDLLKTWQSELIKRTDARIQGYTIDFKATMAQYTYNELAKSQGNIYQLEFDLTDGFITDRPQYARFFYGRYYLGPKIVPNPPFLDSNAIGDVFANLGY